MDNCLGSPLVVGTALHTQFISLDVSWRRQRRFNSGAQLVEIQEAEQSLSSDVVPTSQQTINTTLDDTGTRLIAQVSQSVVQNVYPLPDQTPKQALERLVQMDSFSWATTDSPSTMGPWKTYNPAGILLTKGINDCVCSYFYGIRCDLEVHFRVNSNQFYAGSLMITSLPDLATVYECLATQIARSWQKPKIISAQTQDTIVMQFPWMRAERFLPISSLLGETPEIVLWTVFVDVLTQLRAAFTAPDSLSVQVTGRLVNVQLVWPITDSESKYFRPQSKQVTPRVTPPARPRSRVHFNRGAADPVQQASSAISTTSNSVASTISSVIDAVATPVEDVLGAIQPLASLFSTFLSFDKPELQNTLQRFVQLPSADFTQSDQKTWSLPLTLNKNSYLSTEGSKVPDGGAWTWSRVAMTPALVGVSTFSNSSSPFIYTMVTKATPLAFACSNHLMYRSSVRVMLQFFAPTFVSGRILVLYNPSSITPVASVDNNITRIIDVKGDTTVQFTLPWINPTDFLDVDEGGALTNGPGYIQLSVYNDIVTSDSSTDPNIDVAVWMSAAPDCQFSYPVYQGLYNDAPRRFRPQCDIQQSFTRTFPPFVENCTMYTDQHYCTSEVSDLLTDQLKRFQLSYVPTAVGQTQPVGYQYTPSESTIGWAINNAFVFRRGGVLYRFLRKDKVASPVIQTAYFEGPTAEFVPGSGEAYIQSGNVDATFSIALPWVEEVPYTSQTDYSVRMAVYAFTTTDTDPDFPTVFCAVRDDFELGWLVAPNLTLSENQRRLEINKRRSKRKVSYPRVVSETMSRPEMAPASGKNIATSLGKFVIPPRPFSSSQSVKWF
jgi:hypothetical protein